MPETRPRKSWGLFTHWLIALCIGIVLHLLSWPLTLFVGFFSAMAAFSPGYNPPKITYWQRPAPSRYELVPPLVIGFPHRLPTLSSLVVRSHPNQLTLTRPTRTPTKR